MKIKLFTLCISVLTAFTPLLADEGMWLLPLLKQQNAQQMKEMGLNLEVEDLYNPNATSLKDAVVIFGGGCTGEVISSEGLILTNHHCGYDAIQQHSSVDHDYLTNGFWAMKKSEELPTPDLKVQFIDKIDDVTDYVKTTLKTDTAATEMSYLSTTYLNNLARKKAGEEFLSANPGTEVEIRSFYGGNKYYMFTKKVFTDVRMVGAPPSSIGKFGADTDNWMWPRHTADFSLFRVYADQNGNPADYSPNNVPLRPKKHFNISMKGIKENDFSMIMGFPGRTNRFYTSWEVLQRRDIDNAIRIKMRGIRQQVLLTEMLADPQVRIQYASKYARSSNYWKNSIGMNKGIDALDVVEKKQAQEAVFRQWATDNNHPEYLKALEQISEATTKLNSLNRQYAIINEALWGAVEFCKAPIGVKALKNAIQAKDKKAISEAVDTLEKKYKEFANKNYNAAVDKKVAKAMLKAYIEDIPADQRPEVFAFIDDKFDGNYDKFIDKAFETSIYASNANFEKFKKKPSIKALDKDLMIRFASSVAAKRTALYDEIQPFSNEFTNAMNRYLEGWLIMNSGKAIYPDANSTIRLTYGKVLPYDPRDGVTYHYYTTLKGVMQKEDPNNWEFVVPEKLKQLYKDKDYGPYALADGSMPCNFISNNDITGGNSGSPVINGNGELIGTAFDGNWEAMSGDIVFEPELQRTISADIRYVLFIIDKYAGAKNLIEEMTIIR